MYQFSEMFKDMELGPKIRTYRMHGMGLGLILGWIPAWAISAWLNKGWWMFPLAWIGTTALGFGIGRIIQKK